MDLYRAAALSGLAESIGCLAILFVRYVDFIERRLEEMGSAVVARGGEEALIVPAVQQAMGFVTVLDFVFHPLTLLLAYLTFEGLVRFLAAAATRETLSSLPLYVVARLVKGRDLRFLKG